MSPVPPEFSKRASQRMARVLFLTIWAASLLPALLLAGAGYSLFGALLRQAPIEAQRLLLVAAGGAAALAGLLAWIMGRRIVVPIQALVATLTRFVQGDTEQRAVVNRPDELGALAGLFNQVADELKAAQHLASVRAAESPNLSQSQALLGLAYLVETAPNLGEFQRGALEMMLKQYACSFAALYRIERHEPVGASFAVLTHTAGSSDSLPPRLSRRFDETRINLDLIPTMEWMVSKTLASRRTQSGPAEGSPNLVEASLPIIRRTGAGEERLMGVLDLYAANRVSDSRLGPFAGRALTELQAIASLLALAEEPQTPDGEQRPTGLEARPSGAAAPPIPPGLMPLVGANREVVFNAGRRLAQVETFEQALQAVGEALRGSPFLNALLVQTGLLQDEKAGVKLEAFDCRGEPVSLRPQEGRSGLADLPIAPLEAFFLARRGELLIVDDVGQSLQEARRRAEGAPAEPLLAPLELLQVAHTIGCEAAAFVPDLHGEQLLGVLVMGRPPRPALRNLETPPLNPALLEPMRGLIHLMDVAIERVSSQNRTQRRLAELETVWQVSQTVAGTSYSGETDLEVIYPHLRQQIESMMGELGSFAILYYDAETNLVQVPYMIEEGKRLDIAPFELGSSLSGQVIRTGQPLLLRSRQEIDAMSAKIGSVRVGQAAQSWLGVPMLFSGEALGLIIVQDVQREGRFNEQDLRLLSALATQVGMVVRNARLLETSHRQAQQAQMVNEITARIRRAVDMQSILKTTAEELGLALGARRARIHITNPQAPDPEAQPDSVETWPVSGAPAAEAES